MMNFYVKLLFLEREFKSFFNERPKSYSFTCSIINPSFFFKCEDKRTKKPPNPKSKHVNNNNKYFDIQYISYNILKWKTRKY